MGKAFNRNKPCVNCKKGKHSHFQLYDNEARFSSATDVDNRAGKQPTDSVKGYTWKGRAIYVNQTFIIIRLKTDNGKPGTVAYDGSGQISITLTDGTPVEDIAVDYPDDDESPPP